MIYTIIIGILIIGAFGRSLYKDNRDLDGQSISKKFKIIVDDLNNRVYDAEGRLTLIDKQTFNLYRSPSNELFQFHYSTGILTIKWSYKYFQKEIEETFTLEQARNLSSFDQINFSNEIVQSSSIKKRQFQDELLTENSLTDDKFNQKKLEKRNVSYKDDSAETIGTVEKLVSDTSLKVTFNEFFNQPNIKIRKNGVYISKSIKTIHSQERKDFISVFIFLKKFGRVLVVENNEITDLENLITRESLEKINLELATGNFNDVGTSKVHNDTLIVEMPKDNYGVISYEINVEDNHIKVNRYAYEYNYYLEKFARRITYRDEIFDFLKVK